MSECISPWLFLKAEQSSLFTFKYKLHCYFLAHELFVQVSPFKSTIPSSSPSLILQHKFNLPYGHFLPAVLGIHCGSTLTLCYTGLFKYFCIVIYWPPVIQRIPWSVWCQTWEVWLIYLLYCTLHMWLRNKISNLTALPFLFPHAGAIAVVAIWICDSFITYMFKAFHPLVCCAV